MPKSDRLALDPGRPVGPGLGGRGRLRSAPPTPSAPLFAAGVNLVGGYAEGARVHETPIADFEAQFRLNLRPTYLIKHAAVIPHLLSAGRRRDRLRLHARRRAARSPAPRATSRPRPPCLPFVDALAVEYRKDGIRANAILPSIIDTPGQPRRQTPDGNYDNWVSP